MLSFQWNFISHPFSPRLLSRILQSITTLTLSSHIREFAMFMICTILHQVLPLSAHYGPPRYLYDGISMRPSGRETQMK